MESHAATQNVQHVWNEITEEGWSALEQRQG